ncbi:hypothetical protein WA026_008620 [Henosepilachna vigintioctopunctata]|uniref:Tetraspanin n=1 Tax=Henosepilachna vigintioctopunctata TaxID=420089 RepID=A0AAW1UC40_9CUCU
MASKSDRIFILKVTGFTVLITGEVVASKVKNENYFSEPTIPALCFTLITAGGLVLLTAPVGLYATKKNSSIVLIIFAVCVTTVVFIEVSAAVVGIAAYQGDSLIHLMDNASTMYYTSKEHRRIWDDLQQNLQCCGTFGYWSWTANLPPLSCCPNYGSERSFALACVETKIYIFRHGCTPILRDRANSFLAKLFGCAIITSFLKVNIYDNTL